jgi:hypothetical protein
VLVQSWRMMSKLELLESIEALRLKLRAPRKTSKLALSLKQMWCEGVNFDALRLLL